MLQKFSDADTNKNAYNVLNERSKLTELIEISLAQRIITAICVCHFS